MSYDLPMDALRGWLNALLRDGLSNTERKAVNNGYERAQGYAWGRQDGAGEPGDVVVAGEFATCFALHYALCRKSGNLTHMAYARAWQLWNEGNRRPEEWAQEVTGA